MRHVELLIHTVGRWNPGDVAFIRSLHYQAGQGGGTAELHLECIVERRDTAVRDWPSETNPRFKAHLRFTGVSDLSIKEFGRGDTQITGFDILDLSDRGLEKINYEVEDYENGRIHFFCSEIEVVDVTAI